jgi:AmmeMemoRadiSam system protein B
MNYGAIPMKSLHLILLVLPLVAYPAGVYSQNVRPICDSVGFCWNAGEMDRFVAYLADHADSAGALSDSLVAAISPHDDYLYAGTVYYPLFRMIHAREVVIFGVTHGRVTKELGQPSHAVYLENFDAWQGPYGLIGISPLREALTSELPSGTYEMNNKAHELEHSIEALLPFLQYFNRHVLIMPIMVTRNSLENMESLAGRLARIIAGYASARGLTPGKDIFFLISNDADHYGMDFNNAPYGLDARAHALATENDRRIIRTNLSCEISTSRIRELTEEIWPDSSRHVAAPLWCGRYPITLGLLTAAKTFDLMHLGTMKGQLLKYSDTVSEQVLPFKESSMGLTAVFSYRHWCGWFSEAFTLKRK